MSEHCEFEFAPMKRAVRDPVAQIGNHTSKSEASIQSGTALNAGETENSLDGSIGSRTAKGTQRYARLLDTRTSSRWRPQYQGREELRKCWKEANRCLSTAMLFKLQHWYLQDHGSHTPLQDEGEEPMMGLASSLQTRYEHTQKQKQNQKQKQKQTVVSVDREHRDECTN